MLYAIPGRLISLLTAYLYIAMFLMVPYAEADGFSDAAKQGKDFGIMAVEQYKPGNADTTMKGKGITGGQTSTIPKYNDAKAKEEEQKAIYLTPGNMGNTAGNESLDLVNSSARPADLSTDPIFANKCLEKGADGACTKWSSSTSVLANSYKDCEEIVTPVYETPPEIKTCTGQHKKYEKHCTTRRFVNLTQETINQKCSEYDPGVLPGQVYARCKDRYSWYKVDTGPSWAVDDCFCGYHGAYGCWSNAEYTAVTEAPEGATFFATSVQNIACQDQDGWDYGYNNNYNWYWKYDHSRIERMYILEDSTCPDFDSDQTSGKCTVKNMSQCDTTGNFCVESIKDFESTGKAPVEDQLIKTAISTVEVNCSAKCTLIEIPGVGKYYNCPIVGAETCTLGACPVGGADITPVPGYFSIIGTSQAALDISACDYNEEQATGIPGKVSELKYGFFRNNFYCNVVSGELDNYTVCMRYNYMTVADNHDAGGPLTTTPVRIDWGTPGIAYTVTEMSLRGGPSVIAYRNVWNLSADIVCNDNTSDCKPLDDAGCKFLKTECTNEDCSERLFTYMCGGDGRVLYYKKTTVCAGILRCMGNDCRDEDKIEPGNFAKAAAATEILNNMRIDTVGDQIFPGYKMSCHASPGNCCDDAVSGISIMDYIELAKSAYDLYSMVTDTTPIADFGYAMYNTVGDAVWAISDGAVSIGSTGGATAGTTIGGTIVNVGIEATTAILEATGMAASAAFDLAATLFLTICSVIYVLMILYAIYKIVTFIYGMLTDCDDEDMMTSVKLTLKLCHLVGNVSDEVWGMDLRTRNVYCCFSSILARLIHEQGRPQIGRGWGTADNPDCAGLSSGELGQLDFSKINLSEYMQYVQNKTSVSIADKTETIRKAKEKVDALNGTTPP